MSDCPADEKDIPQESRYVPESILAYLKIIILPSAPSKSLLIGLVRSKSHLDFLCLPLQL